MLPPATLAEGEAKCYTKRHGSSHSYFSFWPDVF